MTSPCRQCRCEEHGPIRCCGLIWRTCCHQIRKRSHGLFCAAMTNDLFWSYGMGPCYVFCLIHSSHPDVQTTFLVSLTLQLPIKTSGTVSGTLQMWYKISDLLFSTRKKPALAVVYLHSDTRVMFYEGGFVAFGLHRRRRGQCMQQCVSVYSDSHSDRGAWWMLWVLMIYPTLCVTGGTAGRLRGAPMLVLGSGLDRVTAPACRHHWIQVQIRTSSVSASFHIPNHKTQPDMWSFKLVPLCGITATSTKTELVSFSKIKFRFSGIYLCHVYLRWEKR